MQTQAKHQCEKCQSPKVDSFFDLKARDIDGKEVQMSRWKDRKAILVVNVASECDTTKQNYEFLNKLYDQYRNQGLEILAFPCNQFKNQEPGSNQEIKKKCCDNFKCSFQCFSKIDVNGSNADPIWRYLRCHSELCKKEGECETIVWNFGKFLLDSKGKVVRYFEPSKDSKDFQMIRKAIEDLINEKSQTKPLGQSKQQTTTGAKTEEKKPGMMKGTEQKQTENIGSKTAQMQK